MRRPGCTAGSRPGRAAGAVSSSWSSVIWRSSAWSSWRKMTISSIRFRNSGRNDSRSRRSSCSCMPSCGPLPELAARPGEAERAAPPGDQVRAQVAGHDQHGVLEVHGAALPVGEPAVVEHLEQDVEHVRVRLLDLVQQHDRVGPPPDGLGELARLRHSRRNRAARRPGGSPCAARRTRSCPAGSSGSPRRTAPRPAPGPARSCRPRSARGTGSCPPAGPGGRARPGTGGPPRRPPRPPRPARRPARAGTVPAASSRSFSSSVSWRTGTPVAPGHHLRDVVDGHLRHRGLVRRRARRSAAAPR